MKYIDELEEIEKNLKEKKGENKIFKKFSFKKKTIEEEELEKKIKEQEILELEEKKSNIEKKISNSIKKNEKSY